MTRLVLPPSLLALQSPETRARLDPVAQLRRDACPPAERAALDAAVARREAHAAQGAAASSAGDAWESDVFAALDTLTLAGVVAWWSHPGPSFARIDGAWRPVARGLCDVVGATRDGRVIVAEVKRTAEHVVDLRATSTSRCRVKTHQRTQLSQTAGVGGVALLVVSVRGVEAVIPWRDVAALDAVNVEVARRYETRSLAAALRREIERER